MEPNNINNTDNFAQKSEAAMEMQAAIVADQIANPASGQPKDNPMVAAPVAKQGGSKGMMIATIIFAVLAVGGIGFGVWTMMDANSQKDSLNSQITSLKKQNNDLLDQVADLNKKIDELEKGDLNGDNSDTSTSDNGASATAKLAAEVLDGSFFIKDENGAVIAKDDARKTTEILSCDNGTATGFVSLECVVMTSEGQGTYIYNLNDRTLNFILAIGTE